ncbi:hypothetical protein FGO68_gene9256 [Halteria grandinella]|uniref:Uncharacterized protein n=1 Tax=Halteria grandinella TaxID=5974 RepID=A0A8J8NR44_HALGN|nr:hypothetical protein FGO68_gene9256 [Halteria grandinella]
MSSCVLLLCCGLHQLFPRLLLAGLKTGALVEKLACGYPTNNGQQVKGVFVGAYDGLNSFEETEKAGISFFHNLCSMLMKGVSLVLSYSRFCIG